MENENEIDGEEDGVEAPVKSKNIVVIGIMGCGKTTVSERLALSLGYGFLDIDREIEKQAGKSIDQIFSDDGEEKFRQIEKDVIGRLQGIRNHVVSVGGGAVVDDDNWKLLRSLGSVVWMNTTPGEIARRIVMSPGEIRARPLIQDLVAVEDKNERLKLLSERLGEILSQRQQRYEEADFVVEDSFSTPETTMQKLRVFLEVSGVI